MSTIDKIFNQYTTSEGVPFYFLNKSVFFPEDESLDIYQFIHADEDIPWTILSYQLYDSISYWWVLSSLNKTSKFYAKRGEIIKIIKPSYLSKVLQHV